MNGQDYFRQQILDTLPSTAHNREVFADDVSYFLGRTEQTLNVPLFLPQHHQGSQRFEANLSRVASKLRYPISSPNGFYLTGSVVCEQFDVWNDRPQFWMRVNCSVDFSRPILKRVLAPVLRAKLFSDFSTSNDFSALDVSLCVSWPDVRPTRGTIDATIDAIALLDRIKNPSINYDRLLAPHYRAAADAIIAAANAAGKVQR